MTGNGLATVASVRSRVPTDSAANLSAALVGGSLTVLFLWWGRHQGAYFGTDFYPGAIGALAVGIVLILSAPVRVRLGGPAGWAMAALGLLLAWTLASILWTSTPGAVFEDSAQVLVYCVLFFLGVWGANLLGRRMLLALLPVGLAGLLVGLFTVSKLWNVDSALAVLGRDATLSFPLGYRNANATFFLMTAWPCIVLAAESRFHWLARAGFLASATLSFELALLSQSRGSLPAAIVALAVVLIVSRRRLRVVTFLGLAILPILPAAPTLLDVFQHGRADAGALPFIHDAARTVALSSLVSLVLAGGFITAVESRLRLGRSGVQMITRVLAVATAIIVVVGGAAVFSRYGGPVSFIDQRVSELKQDDSPDFQGQRTRFGFNVGTERPDLWRVALSEGAQHPFLGGGTGSFQVTYLRERDTDLTPRDPHSIELLMLSELGVPGLLLFATLIGGSFLAAGRSRRLGPNAAALCAGSLGGATEWLVQGSYDWLWHYPGLAGPALYLFGAAAAPAVLDPAARWGPAKRKMLAGIGVAAIAAFGVLLIGERLVGRALGARGTDPVKAVSDLELAARFDPFDPEPLLVGGVIAEQSGRRGEAIDLYRQAIARSPDEYAPHLYLARALIDQAPATARIELAKARELNPTGHEVTALETQLRSARGPATGN